MKTLQQITSETCTYKIQSMRLTYVSELMEKCRNCDGEYYVQCERYKPLSRTQLNIRQGANAMMNAWYRR